MSNLKTKIVCTIGPSTWNPDIMKQMIETGMTCARVNGAFADEAELDKVTKLVRDVSSDVALMMDAKGPEVRLNKFPTEKKIQPGEIILIGNDATSEIYPANYKDLYKSLEPGQRIVIGDGDVEFKIDSINGDKMYCEVVFGEILKPGKAMNLPGANVNTTALTERDIINIKHAITLGWEYVSASFIQTKEAAVEVKKHLEGSNMKLIAKIEDQSGIDNIDEILEVVDGIMVARGGLGVELGLEQVPMVQRYLIEKANAAGKPVITATQMLESMINNSRPTRAEINDIEIAVMTGSDAVMVSGETTVGKFPVETVQWMKLASLAAEKNLRVRRFNDEREFALRCNPDHDNALGKSAVAITDATVEACVDLDIKAILVVTKHGFTARMLSRHKLQQPIYAFVSDENVAKNLMLVGGVQSVIKADMPDSRDEAITEVIETSLSNNFVKQGDLVAIVIGSKMFTGVEASILEIRQVA